MKLLAGIASLAVVISSVKAQGDDTRPFYLVSSSSAPGPDLKALRIDDRLVSLSSGTALKLQVESGQIVRVDSADPRPFIDFLPEATGCSKYGKLGFAQSSSNKCSQFDKFYLKIDPKNGQLGSKLVFNDIGGFYACDTMDKVVYKVNSTDGPSDCNPIELWTVPVF